MKRFTFAAVLAASSFAVNAGIISFDDGTANYIAPSGSAGTYNGEAYGDPLRYDSLGLSVSAYLSKQNMTDVDSFTLDSNTAWSGRRAYQDGGSYAGLGAIYVNATGNPGTDDSFQSNVDANVRKDEMLMFTFDEIANLSGVYFNGDHTPTTDGYANDGTDQNGADDSYAIFNIFYHDGNNVYKSVFGNDGFKGNNARTPVGGDFLATGIDIFSDSWIVAATGWSTNGDTANIHASYVEAIEYKGSVPAPASLALFGLGLIGLGLAGRKKKRD